MGFLRFFFVSFIFGGCGLGDSRFFGFLVFGLEYGVLGMFSESFIEAISRELENAYVDVLDVILVVLTGGI